MRPKTIASIDGQRHDDAQLYLRQPSDTWTLETRTARKRLLTRSTVLRSL